MTDPPPDSSRNKDGSADLQRDLQDGINWLIEMVKPENADANRLPELLERQRGLMLILIDSYSPTKIVWPTFSESHGLERKQQKLLKLLAESLRIAITLAQGLSDNSQHERARVEILEIEEKEKSNAPVPYRSKGGSLDSPRSRLIPEDDIGQDVTGYFADLYASMPRPVDNEQAAHRALLFYRAKDVQDVVSGLEPHMSEEMKTKIHKLGMALEWTKAFVDMEESAAERIARRAYMTATGNSRSQGSEGGGQDGDE
ncbi:hypothetical protein DE146DRAFT_274460 [Phaeosphaeria sp. MPI-PUGE-AT-0046c]|nr:hypothetical protein DE146DRAFT_274460 [Phaeosphaeria sp. MPI-PUGE-AT-0046c]